MKEISKLDQFLYIEVVASSLFVSVAILKGFVASFGFYPIKLVVKLVFIYEVRFGQ